jgi:hypothetical protein
MKVSTEPLIISSDMTSRGIIVTFADGKCALYTASFLYGTLRYAEIIPDDDFDAVRKEDNN